MNSNAKQFKQTKQLTKLKQQTWRILSEGITSSILTKQLSTRHHKKKSKDLQASNFGLSNDIHIRTWSTGFSTYFRFNQCINTGLKPNSVELLLF